LSRLMTASTGTSAVI